MAFGPRNLIEAVANGKRAALSIDDYLRDATVNKVFDLSIEKLSTRNYRMPEDYEKLERQSPPTISLDRRTGISEVETGYNVYVAGVPSMRHVSTIPVFAPYPATGYGYDEESKKMLGGFTWGDVHHPALSETKGDYDGRWLIRPVILFAVCLLLTACEKKESQPVEIAPEDMCAFCRMAIFEKRFAAEFITHDGEALKFDDIGCTLDYVKGKQNQINTKPGKQDDHTNRGN